MYFFDTNVFISIGHYYPSRFPTFWQKLDELVSAGQLFSVKEVKNELERQSHFQHIDDWVRLNVRLFLRPNENEQRIVAQIFQLEQFRGLVRRNNILRGLPVADPFLVAAAKLQNGTVVTQESFRPGGARVPTLCQHLNVGCIDLEGFLERENLQY